MLAYEVMLARITAPGHLDSGNQLREEHLMPGRSVTWSDQRT